MSADRDLVWDALVTTAERLNTLANDADTVRASAYRHGFLRVTRGLEAGDLWAEGPHEPVQQRRIFSREWHEVQPIQAAASKIGAFLRDWYSSDSERVLADERIVWPVFVIDGHDVSIVRTVFDVPRMLEPWLNDQPVDLLDASGRPLAVRDDERPLSVVLLPVPARPAVLRMALTAFLSNAGEPIPEDDDIVTFANQASEHL